MVVRLLVKKHLTKQTFTQQIDQKTVILLNSLQLTVSICNMEFSTFHFHPRIYFVQEQLLLLNKYHVIFVKYLITFNREH